jgi:hypothetical protein
MDSSNKLPLQELQNNKVKSLNLNGNRRVVASFHSHSYSAKNIGTEAAIELFEVLKSNSSLTALFLSRTRLVASLLLTCYVTGNQIDPEGAIILSEALKVNSSLASLDLSCTSCCFISFLTQYREQHWH